MHIDWFAYKEAEAIKMQKLEDLKLQYILGVAVPQELESQKKRYEATIQFLKQEVETKDNSIVKLCGDVDRLSKIITKYVEERDNLRHTLQSQKEAYAIQKSELSDLHRLIEDLRKQIETKKAEFEAELEDGWAEAYKIINDLRCKNSLMNISGS